MDNLRIPIPYLKWQPPVYYCKRATKPFVLDGNVKKEFWEDAQFTDAFLDIEGENMPKPRFRTQVKMLWDNENFYFGAILEGDEIWATLTERDSVIFHDNDFEIFIDPDSDTHQYFEFEMNALNTVWDLFLTKPYRDFGGRPLNGWDIKGLQTAVYIDGTLNKPDKDNKCWMAEVVIPFAALKEMSNGAKSPVVGDYYRVNFSRVHWNVDIENGQYTKKTDQKTGKPLPENNWVWAPTGVINIHYPEYWGFVFFTENGEKYSIPEEEYIKWELRKISYLEQRHFDRYGRYANSLEEMEVDLPISIQPKILVAGRKFEISCVTKSGNAKVYIYEDGKTEVIDCVKLEEELRRPPYITKDKCTKEEYKYVDFLYKNMPLSDLGTCDESFFVDVVRHALMTRNTVNWKEKINEELFLNFILPYRINNENPTFYHTIFFKELYPKIKDSDLAEAAVAVNYWCMSKAVYQSTNERTGSPFTIINNAFGRCGEESTLTVAALRSVGIPARQCYAPRWSHCDDNHAWVEVYTGDGWHYLGACEPEIRLDTGWFRLAASKAMLVHTRAFSDCVTQERLIQSNKSCQEINVLNHYANTCTLNVFVEDKNKRPISNAKVDFTVVNYSEFYPIISLMTDENGCVTVLTGEGDLILHISKDNKYLERHIDTRQIKNITIDFSEAKEQENESYTFRFTPPVGGVNELEPLSNELATLEKIRFEENEQTRLNHIATFPTSEDEKALEQELRINNIDGCIVNARGNANEIKKFLRECKENELDLAVRLLKTLQQKDLADISVNTLKTHLGYAVILENECKCNKMEQSVFDEFVLCPRIWIEFITPFYEDINKYFTEKELNVFKKEPLKAVHWVKNNIAILRDAPFPEIKMTPKAVLKLGMGNDISRKILTIAILRTCGVASRLEKSDSCISYWNGDKFVRLEKSQEDKINSVICIRREEGSFQEYYKNFTIAKLNNGIYKTLNFDHLKWENNSISCCIDEGIYRIITTDRQPDESNIVFVDFIEIKSAEKKTYTLIKSLEEIQRKNIVVTDRNLILENGEQISLNTLIHEKDCVICWIETSTEPTEHLLNELIENSEHFSQSNKDIIICVKNPDEITYKTLKNAQQAISNLLIAVDSSFVLENEYKNFSIKNKNLPLIVTVNNGNGSYAFSGYQVGIGKMILKYINL